MRQIASPTLKFYTWNKIKELALELSGVLWDSEEKEIRRIIDAAPVEEKQIVVSFAHTIDCDGLMPTIKCKISFSEKFSATETASVEDPAQLPLSVSLGKEA